MSDSDILVRVRSLVPTPGGAGVFIGTDEKVITIFVDAAVAQAIGMALAGEQKPRPMTHDLIGHIFTGLGVSLRKVVINDYEGETYFARLELEQQNELGQSLVEIDARPSDSIALALRLQAPIFMAKHVLDEAEDMTWALEEYEDGGQADDGAQES